MLDKIIDKILGTQTFYITAENGTKKKVRAKQTTLEEVKELFL